MNSYDTLKTLLLAIKPYCTTEGTLNLAKIQQEGFEATPQLINALCANARTKALFFTEQNGVLIYHRDKFLDFISNKNFLANSYTKFSNKIGLAVGNRFFKQNCEVVLNFPFKDCLLEGGQSKDDKKQHELFFNETLAHDEIDKLLAPKVLTHAKLFNAQGAYPLFSSVRGEAIADRKQAFTRNRTINQQRNLPEDTISDNLIIKGNNLIALHTLKTQFQDKIKLIYIDPPYNTGNDSFGYNDNFNHSTWLTFMKNRLEVARELLKDDGVIFVQCDDNEQAYLKVLMDEIFRRENFVSTVAWRKTDNQANIGNIARVKEFILMYCKNQDYLKLYKMKLTERAKKEYRYSDKKGKFRRAILLDKTRGRYFYDVRTSTGKILNGPWMKKENEFKEMDKNDQIYWTSGGDEQPYGKIYLDDSEGQIPNDFLNIEFGTNQEGSIHISHLFNNRIFDFPKPETLLSHFIQISTQKNDIVLDYHLGSGTTAAVAHKMGRQYIGVEQMDYIEEIAVERLKKVIQGEQGGISKAVDWQGGGEFIYLELKQNTATLMDHITHAKTSTELLTIKNSLQDYTFIDYRLNFEFLKEKGNNQFKDFNTLSLEQQKKTLISLLDKNQLYVNYSERDDSLFNVSASDKQLSGDFYQ